MMMAPLTDNGTFHYTIKLISNWKLHIQNMIVELNKK